MLKNHNHDLVQQLSEVSDGLWRIEQYVKNAKGCAYCLKIWKQVQGSLERASKILTEEIVRHVKEGRFE